MQLLTTIPEIKAAIAIMNPIAREAAQGVADYLLENIHLMGGSEPIDPYILEGCYIALEQAGYDMYDEIRIREWMENHLASVQNVSISIVVYVVKEKERKEKWGWLGTAAAVAGGVIIGSIFG